MFPIQFMKEDKEKNTEVEKRNPKRMLCTVKISGKLIQIYFLFFYLEAIYKKFLNYKY